MKIQNWKLAIIGTLALCVIAALLWMLSGIGQDSSLRPPTGINTKTLDTKTPSASDDSNRIPQSPSSPLPLIHTSFRKDLGIKLEDIRKLWEDHVLWAGADRSDAHRIAIFIKPATDVEVGENYDIYPLGEYAGESTGTVSPLFRESSRNKILLCSIGIKLKPKGSLAQPDEGQLLFGHDYVLRWWDLKGPAGEIRFRTPNGPEEGVKDYSMDLVLTSAGLYPKKE